MWILYPVGLKYLRNSIFTEWSYDYDSTHVTHAWQSNIYNSNVILKDKSYLTKPVQRLTFQFKFEFKKKILIKVAYKCNFLLLHFVRTGNFLENKN